MRRLRRLKPIAVGAFLLLFLFGLYQTLVIRSIECKTNLGECTMREKDILSINKNKSSFFVNRKEINEEIKKDPRVEKVNIKFGIGIKLSAEIIYQSNSIGLKVFADIPSNATGSAVIWSKIEAMSSGRDASEASYFRVWEDGFITSSEKLEQVDGVLYADKLPSQKDLDSIHDQLSYIRQNFPGKIVYIQENAILFRVDDMNFLLFDIKKDPQKVFETLQQIQAVTTIEEGIRLIDLRFNKPIISLNKK